MGVKKGNSLINKYGKEISLETLRGNIVIVDLFYVLHKFIRLDISNPLYYILEVINLIEKFKYYGIKPIFVIDGRPPLEKTKKLQKTREKSTIKLTELLTSNDTNTNTNTKKADSLLKKSLCVTSKHIHECEDLFNRLDCLYIHVKNCEGDTVIAELASLLQKDVNVFEIVYVYSADFDMFLYFDIQYILKELDFEKDTFKLYIKKYILNDLNISNEELVLAGFLSGTSLNCGLYKATMESSIELNKCFGPFKSLDDFVSVLPSINNNREENHKILIPSYNFTDRYELVTKTFSLNNTNSFSRTSIIKFINEKVKIIQEKTNTLSNFFNVKYVLEYIQSITQESYLIQKYRGKIRDYSKIHFGVNIILDIDTQDQDLENPERKDNINHNECYIEYVC
jgi:hypothetical protein